MRFKRQISFAIIFILTVFLITFSVLMYVGDVSFRLKDLKNQSTQLLAYMYRLNFEIKSILTATAISTVDLRKNFMETVTGFEQALDLVEKNSKKLMADPELSKSMKNAKALWGTTRKDLYLISDHLRQLGDLGLDRRIGFISRSQYAYLSMREDNSTGKERYHLLSLENAIESFSATSFSYSLVFTNLNDAIAVSSGAYIRYSILSSVIIIVIVVAAALIFFFLFSHQALVLQLDRLIDEALLKEKKIRETELRALRYQINPHFLYNTIGSIRAVAVDAGQGEIAEMLRVLSRLLRNTISRGADCISVAEERQVIADYISILQIRYRNKLAVTFDFADGIDHVLMPSLLLQPIIENAVLHGLSRRLNDPDGGARLEISARVSHSFLMFEVRDNGTGMDEIEVAKAFSVALRDPNPEGIHIGIPNIQERIQRQCGKAFGLSIQSSKGEYTSVRIKLPALREV